MDSQRGTKQGRNKRQHLYLCEFREHQDDPWTHWANSSELLYLKLLVLKAIVGQFQVGFKSEIKEG